MARRLRRCAPGRGAHRRSSPPSALLAAGALLLLLTWSSAELGAAFAGSALLPSRRSAVDAGRGRVAVAQAAETAAEVPAVAQPAKPSAEDAKAAEGAYREWADQFPIAAARRDFYGLSCKRADIEERFFAVARLVGISPTEALTIFEPDLWILSIPTETVVERLEALREVAASEEEVEEFLRFAPRSLGTTSATEIRERGVDNMKARAALGAGYEMLVSPLRLLFKSMAKSTASTIQVESDEEVTEEVLEEFEQRGRESRGIQGTIFLSLSLSVIGYLLYTDVVYGGPIHGKGLCPASPIPTFNIPDAEGNTRLPCNCAPIWKWYIEPTLPKEERMTFQPKVESKNCGGKLVGTSKECDPTTVGGCVWTAADLEKDPSTWDRRGELTFWEKTRLSQSSS